MKIIQIQKEFQIPGTNVILEEGDQIRVLPLREEQYGLFLLGGSIGNKNKETPFRTFDSEDEAKDTAKRMNKTLSPGEKQYYHMKYVVRKI